MYKNKVKIEEQERDKRRERGEGGERRVRWHCGAGYRQGNNALNKNLSLLSLLPPPPSSPPSATRANAVM
jgi:hypothetical protein